MKSFYFYLFIFIWVESLYAQPNWSVSPSDYQYSMTLITELNIDGTYLRSTNDFIGAFSGGVCRGVAQPIYNADQDKYYTYLTVYSNSPGDVINFKIYNSSTGIETDIQRTIEFAPDVSIGSQFQSFVVAEPPLRSEAELLTYSFFGVEYNALVIDGTNLNFYIDGSSYDITQLDPVFTVSPGAKIYINQVEQSSTASETRDFSNEVVYQVMSEDKTILNEYTVAIELVSSGSGYSSGGGSSGAGGGGSSGAGGSGTTSETTDEETSGGNSSGSGGGGGGGGGGSSGSGGNNSSSNNDADFIITQSEDTTIVSEQGLEDIIIVNITESITNRDVVLDIELNDSTEIDLSTKRLTFSPENWSVPQLITVKGIDDNIMDGNSTTILRFTVVDSLSDNNYTNLDDKVISVLNIDDESLPNFILSESDGMTVVNETGSTDQIGVLLSYPPTDDVILNITSSQTDEVQLNNTNLVFTSTNWNIEQFVTVQGVDDEEDDEDQTIILTFEVDNSTLAQEYLEVSSQSIHVINENVFTEPEAPVYYKKDAVCYNGGAIKVVYSVEGTKVSLNLNGQKITEKSISNGEVIFSDLEQGSYVIGIIDKVKIINIGLDE